jgi:hypothetical protein
MGIHQVLEEKLPIALCWCMVCITFWIQYIIRLGIHSFIHSFISLANNCWRINETLSLSLSLSQASSKLTLMVKFDGSFMEWKNRRKREVWLYIHSLVNSYFEFFFEKDLNYPSAFFLLLLLLLFTSSFKGPPTPPISTISTFLLIHSLVLSRAQLSTSLTKPSSWYLWLCAFS